MLSIPPRRIAAFHLNSLSGLIFSLPALKALREGLPGAHLCSIVRPTLAPLLKSTGLCDEILQRPRGGLPSQAALMARLAAHHFDLAIAFSPSRNTTLLAFSTAAHTRIGFSDAKMEALFTHRVATGALGTESLLDLVRAIDVAPRQLDARNLVPILPNSVRKIEKMLEAAQIERDLILFAPETAAKRKIRAWTNAHWIELAQHLAPRWKIGICGVRAHPELTPKTLETQVFDWGGKTDLLDLAALLSRARLVVAPDGGAFHLAAALGIPVVGLYGPSDPTQSGPRGAPFRVATHPVECAPCLLSRCKWSGEDERKCLTRLEPESVAHAVRELIGL